ncbi:acetyl-CoA C-acyltransferase [Pedobacter sp. ISL-68]|jgi:acetyl-CoA acyltransferase|uniref:acetyl-CoA C-acyltransferase n=3 Tax=Pedobacter TaxID=84567 RepID=A0A366LB97_9SPHI|nr:MULTISPECIES: acetyl-CoA C-acyltransferase [Pedobacter]ARS41366.1 acetyl-CoA acetyltransferase [Sphingobacteriaceae bacterium GW460-11-11-14-LB5]MBT2561838.1 acetyl-CoA C-acyltransferase [Pedobacter sp. ISL-64]MBT2592496.1 acetyl-CoA C-acyltransferase [Pedobacter sp. ISL-68]QDW26634.1 acetyl-CoA C-acyltransferase [Pedobacter sp. KBS0701]RBQ10422.1 acetyl-CoA C-acyltransferase [Pedobacter miscanthi]
MEAYIIAGYRTAVGKAPRGVFRFTRADDLAAEVIRALVASVPNLDNEQIDDVIVGNATPEAEQGLNIGRMISLMGLDTDKVPGVTVNRYCASGLDTIATAVAKIKAGMADCIIAGGVEVMSGMPFGGWKLVPNAEVAKNNPDWYWGMGLTAEAVAKEYNVSREDQDAFSLKSHEKAIHAIKNGHLKDGILPITVNENYLDANLKKKTRSYVVDTDEGPRADTTLDKLAKLKPVFDAVGSVTAGNSSQTSDGAAFVLVVSEKKMKELNAEPIARLVSYGIAGVPPRIMGIGPIEAIPKALKQAGLKKEDIDLIELNEAFASQSLAVIRTLDLNPDVINVNGGAIALGHPLGCTGAKLTVQIMNELKRQNKKYGMVTMCVGTGQGAAGIFELL